VSPSGLAFPSASPGADAGALADPIVFRISATATANTGQTAHLVETVHAPHTITGTERATLTSALCSGWKSEFPAAVGLPVDLKTTRVRGTWPKHHQVGVVASYLSSAHTYTAAAWTGSWEVLRANCSDGIAVIPGSATGVILVDPNAPVDAESWGGGGYGFHVDFDEGDKAKPTVTLSHCTIEIGSGAAASPLLSALTSADATHGCVFGSID
jgi:hypothetical protein